NEDIIKEIPKQCNLYILNLNYYALPESRASMMNKKTAGALIYYPTFLLKKALLPYYLLKYNKYRNQTYDVAIAFSGHLNDIFFVKSILKSKRKIVWAHGMIYQYLLLSAAFEKSYRKFDAIACINQLDQSEIFVHKPYLNYKIYNIYNPIPDESNKIDPTEVARLKERFGDFILMIARMSPPKDHKTLIKAYQEILKEQPTFNKKLVLVGDGEESDHLKELVSSMNLNDNIIFEGSKANVFDYYKAADIMVLSSESEGLPTVLVESMEVGTPVISSDCPRGAQDILRNETYGLMFDVGNVKQLKEKILLLSNDQKVYQHYVEMGYQRLKDFAPETIMKQFEDILNGK
ncbi:MAG: glycosyltransferase, partial [Erysipelotrichaceae bacterium]